ncbi:hypothetical protein GCM10016455_17300 [Aliiroseovarius zhejiangensis]|uniref:SIR2-like domain-containing protein n=1 Tax=Aliiroseovarius zhejiangensis TaxID=1632025 RepID=A0ABQ3J324_9RHOB|nr:hypothetical protein [Aliiroseovarius zhejiangensis]GHE97360.1 hypothetical protein GCM10016455_17300 [Aliiroseovarius zhejiangensis]
MNKRRKSVFVVGAGASKEFNLPTGAELKQKIAQIGDIKFDEWGQKLASGDPGVVDALRERAKQDNQNSISPYLHAAWQVRDNMPIAPSIDNFLDTHRSDSFLVDFGKIAIAKAIRSAERHSLLCQIKDDHGQPKINFENVRETWIAQLFSILVAQRDFQSFLDALNDITFVSFNYDRCIHQFFAYASKSYFNLRDQEVEAVLGNLNILYPYGTVGEFSIHLDSISSFNRDVNGASLLQVSKGIKTFTEGVESAQRDQIWKAMDEASLIAFLGFGFLDLNMDLLIPDDRILVDKVIATGKGLSENSRSDVVKKLTKTFFKRSAPNVIAGLAPEDMQVLNCTCSSLIFEFHRYLSRV